MRTVGLYGKTSPRIHPALKDFVAYLTQPLPPAPPSVDYSSKVPEVELGMDGNDRYGDCGFAGADHVRKMSAGEVGLSETFPTADEIVKAYLDYNQGQDVGVNLQELLQFWYTQGIWGSKIAGYAPIHPQDVETMRSALYLFGHVYVGSQVQAAQEQQFAAGQPWDYDAQSQVVGGHCTVITALNATGGSLITWGAYQPFTKAWWQAMGDEAWAVITSEDALAEKGPVVDLAALQADLNTIGEL